MMGALTEYFLVFVICAFAQTVVQATQNDHEPMVAFICGKPAMHRGVNGWISDENTKDCWDDKRDILKYCQQIYPNHNITNVVETTYLVSIPGWPSYKGVSLHTHRVRPFRCIVDSFESDALLVPQHCKFDHKHDEDMCKEFSHWEVVARDACAEDGLHCESFGMLLNCGLGTFRGVEYVCCPTETPTHTHPTPASAEEVEDSDEDEDDSESDSEEDFDDEDEDEWDSEEDEDEDVDEDDMDDEEDDEEEEEEDLENDVDADSNLYELYLKGELMPAVYRNEHQKFEAARRYMHRLQEAKKDQLMKEWTAARDHVNEVRRTDQKTADRLSMEITERFERLYSAYEEEDEAEKEQIMALHQQRVQSDLNQRKRVAMDKYMRSLQRGDVNRISSNLRNYIRAEEKDMEHTVNHYTHVKATDAAEAARIHAGVIDHLRQCQQRMEQALEMLERYPEVERQVRPSIESFMKNFDDMANRIRVDVLPDPAPASMEDDDDSEDDDDDDDMDDDESEDVSMDSDDDDDVDDFADDEEDDSSDEDMTGFDDSWESDEDDSIDDDEDDDDDDDNEDYTDEDDSSSQKEDEHDYERNMFRPANQLHSNMHVQQGLQGSSHSSTAQLGTTFAIAIGSVAVFVVLVVAVVLLRRRSTSRTSVTHGYVEVDPAASPEERHVANMQMNGYENPTYRYFEVQTAK